MGEIILELNKLSHHNPLEVLCVPTCIKNIIDNQFKNVQLSRSLINKWCYFKGNTQDIMGLDALAEYLAPKLLINKKIKYSEKQPGKIKDIKDLLNRNVFPTIIFKLEDYNTWKKKTSIEVEKAGSTTHHAMLVCGFNSSKEIIYIYDPIYDRYNPKKYKSKNPLELYDTMTFLDFTRLWDKGFNAFMFWLEEAESVKKAREEHRTLDKYQNG